MQAKHVKYNSDVRPFNARNASLYQRYHTQFQILLQPPPMSNSFNAQWHVVNVRVSGR
jgi:hypothetical protein